VNWKSEVDKFKAGMKIENPSMSSSFLRIGYFGLTGGGKSVTSGIFALGLTGPTGLIGWIDGEGRRSGYAIDEVAELAAKYYGKPKQSFIDRFKVVHVDPPFNPLAGVAAIETLEQAGCKTIIADLCSQLWDSEGGYLDMKEDALDRIAGSDDAKRQRSAAAAAAQVKPWTHGKFISKVNSAKAHMILVFQAKNKWNPKTNKVDEFVSPIQESGLTRTALIVGRVECSDRGNGGYCTFQAPPGQGTKFTHNAILKLLPQANEQLTFAHGEAIAKWCGSPVPVSAISTNVAPDIKALKRVLWETTREVHCCVKGEKEKAILDLGVRKLNQWMWDESVISDTEAWETLTAERLPDVIGKAKEKLESKEVVP